MLAEIEQGLAAGCAYQSEPTPRPRTHFQELAGSRKPASKEKAVFLSPRCPPLRAIPSLTSRCWGRNW